MALISYSQLKEVLQDFKTNIQAKFVENITFDDSIDVATNKSKNTLKQTKNNQETVVINHVVENWGDLEHTKYAPIQNIFDKTKTEQDKHYTPIAGQIGTILDNTDYVVGYVPCLAGEQFTIIKGATHDSRQAGVFNSQRQCIHNMNLSYRTVKGKQVYNVEIPANLADAAFFAFNMHKVHTNPNDVMVFKGILSDDEIPNEYYPNLGNYTTVIDADKVAMQFDNSLTSLQSNTLVNAVKELGVLVESLGSSSYQGKKILVYGDTLAAQTDWINHVKNYLSSNVEVMATNNIPLSQVNNDATFSLSHQDKLTELSNKIVADSIDTVIVVGGMEDVDYDGTVMQGHRNMSLENINNLNDVTTIRGSLTYIINHILTTHPNVSLIFTTVPYIKHHSPLGTNNNHEEYKNLIGFTPYQINNMIKETASRHGVPCIDLASLSEICHLNRSLYLSGNTTLNDEGNKHIANVVVGELMRFNKRIV